VRRASTLALACGREVREVISTMRGPLQWKKDGDRTVITCPVPEAVDVVILR
jgi:hypothetical protein